MHSYLKEGLRENGHEICQAIQDQLLSYLNLMDQWNRVYNLTAISDPRDRVYLHILDSLAVGPYLLGSRILDVGTGAGLPGIPLALTHPDKLFVLLDSNNKKIRFLNQVMYELKIKNLEIVHARCEEYCPNILFDSILSRAFASLQDMLAKTKHLLNKDGVFLAMKGAYPVQELAEILPAFRMVAINKLAIHGLNAERHLVRIALKE